MTTYQITEGGQLPGQRYTYTVEGEIVRTTKAFVTIRTKSGKIIRRGRQNVREEAPKAQAPVTQAPILGYVNAAPPSIGLRPDLPLAERLEAFQAALKRMDWHYQMSDDHRVYKRGLYWEQELLTEYKALRQIDPALLNATVAASGCLDKF